MADRSVFRTAVRTPSAQMDADFSTLHALEAAGEVVDEGCRRVRERGQIDIVRCLAPRTPDGEPWISKPSLRPVSTRRTSAWQIVEWPILAAGHPARSKIPQIDLRSLVHWHELADWRRARREGTIDSQQLAIRRVLNSGPVAPSVHHVCQRLRPCRRRGRECGRPCERWKNDARSGRPFCRR